MKFDILSGFNVGQKLGEGQNPLADTITGVLDRFQKRGEEDRKFKRDVDLTKAKAMAEAEAKKSLHPTGGGSGNFTPTKYTINGVTYEDVDANLQRDIESKRLIKMTENIASQGTALDAVNALKNKYYESIPEGKGLETPKNAFSGLIKKGKTGVERKFGAMGGKYPSLQTYLSNREGFASLISKRGFAEAGMLTNQDIQRIVNMLPSEFSTEAEAGMAWKEIEDILQSARNNYEREMGNKFGNEQATTGLEGMNTSPSGNSDQLRQEAMDAINKGAPESAVRERFKQQTGQEL